MRKKTLPLLALTLALLIGGPARCESEPPPRLDVLASCLESECGPLIESLVRQSEADSLAIEKLLIRLKYANDREQLIEAEKPSALERFMATYGFAIGAAVGVYVGAAAVR